MGPSVRKKIAATKKAAAKNRGFKAAAGSGKAQKKIILPTAAGVKEEKRKRILSEPLLGIDISKADTSVFDIAKKNKREIAPVTSLFKSRVAEMKDILEMTDRAYLPVSDFKISSPYGVDRVTHRHSGIDLAVPVGTEVAAVKDGIVSFAGWGNGYGYRVVIDHPDGTQTTYNHLSDIGVKVGENVDSGKTIALSGNTGNSTGPHLHFEVKEDGRYVDPELYFDFGNGLKAPGDDTYTSQMEAVASSGRNSSAGQNAQSGGKRSSVKKNIDLMELGDFPEYRYFHITDSDVLPMARSVKEDYFISDLNPLLDLIPAYRHRATRTPRTKTSR